MEQELRRRSRGAAEFVSPEPNRSVNRAGVELSPGGIGVTAALRCKKRNAVREASREATKECSPQRELWV